MTDAVTDLDAEATQQKAARRALGTMLVERGLLESARLDEALRIGTESGERLGEVVVRLGWVTEEDLAKVLADQWQLRYLDRSGISFDADALSRLSHEEANRLEALPMRFEDDGAMMVALAEPTEARLLALRSLLGDRIAPVVVPKSALDLGLRGDLLARRGDGGEAASAVLESPVAPPAEEEQEDDDMTTTELEPAAAATGEADVSDFDATAETMIEDLRSRIGSLREVVVEARFAEERGRLEVERLQGELAQRERELAERGKELEERTRSLRDLQETLRGLADGIAG